MTNFENQTPQTSTQILKWSQDLLRSDQYTVGMISWVGKGRCQSGPHGSHLRTVGRSGRTQSVSETPETPEFR